MIGPNRALFMQMFSGEINIGKRLLIESNSSINTRISHWVSVGVLADPTFGSRFTLAKMILEACYM